MTQAAANAEKPKDYARWRRRDHANIESLQNSVIAELSRRADAKYRAENEDDEAPPAFEMPANVRHLISALQGAHGGGAVAFEEFERDYLTIGAQLQFRGTPEAIRSRVRSWVKKLDDWQFLVGVQLFVILPGGEVLYDDGGKLLTYPDGSPVRTKTKVIDYLKPRADEGMMRARASALWREHPGKALGAQVESVVADLPTLGTRAESGKEKTHTPLPVDLYEQRQEERIVDSVEKCAHEIELKGGDAALWVRTLARAIHKMGASLEKTENARHDLISLDRVRRGEDEGSGSTAYMCQSDDDSPPSEFVEPDLSEESDPCTEKLTQAGPEVLAVDGVENRKTAGYAPEVLAEANRRAGLAQQFAAERIGVLAIWGTADGMCDCPKGSECRSPGKHPHGRLALNGVYSSTGDTAAIRDLFRADPRMNYGLAMGGELNLICVDIDPRNDGDATYYDLCEAHGDGAFPKTFTVRTGGDGWHRLYRMPEEIKAATGELKAKLGPGVDVKAQGGYIVGAGSSHVSGKSYEVEENEYIAPAPEWIVRALRKAAAGDEPEKVIDFQAHRDRKPLASSGVARTFGRGERNDGLRDVCLGRWVHGWAETPEDLFRQLVEVRDTRCEWAAGDPPPSDSELRDLIQRTVRKYARGQREGAA
jgi:hypothetical protein